MNKELEKKFKLFVLGLEHRSGPFGALVWESSAQRLEKDLRACGVKLPIKIYHRYKLPDAATPQQYINKMGYIAFCRGLPRVELYKEALLKSDKFSNEEKELILTEVQKNKDSYERMVRDDWDEIKRLNPELSEIKVNNRFIDDAVAGALFGFGPDEIDFYINDYIGEKSFEYSANQSKKLKIYGIIAGLVLAPKTAEIVITALEEKARSESDNIKKIDVKLSLKAKMLFVNLAIDNSSNGICEWYSSAKNLEEELKRHGIKNIKLYHKYKMPDNTSQSAYMIKNIVREFAIHWFNEKQLDIYLEYKVKDEKERQNIKQEILRYVAEKRDFYKKEEEEDYKKLLSLNPELPDSPDELYRGSIFDGAIYGFGPDEIKYFITEYKGSFPGSKSAEVSDKLKSYGISTGYVLAPKTAEKVIAALEKNVQNKNVKSNVGRTVK